jgi:predicted metal-dependent phosphoesterase TrpH
MGPGSTVSTVVADVAEGLWRVDLHMHTRASPDSWTAPAALVARARKVGLRRIAVTDHNTISGALAAQALAPDLVIVGEEIRTDTGGELLAYYVREEVPRGLPIHEVILRLRGQGAIISVSHPVDRFRSRSAMGESRTLQIIEQVDALEGFNARCLAQADNQRATELAALHGKTLTAGSDAHTLAEIGAGYLELPSFDHNPDAFLRSLRGARAGGHLSGLWPRFMTMLARRGKQ